MPMKKVYLFCLLAFLAFGTSTASANDGKLSKVLQKECKQQIKRLKKEGWTVWGKTQTIESALEAHFLEMEEYGKAEQMPKLEGKRMIMMIAPLKKK